MANPPNIEAALAWGMAQKTIPGCTPVTQRELAERRAREPLKPARPQKPCDLGLFSDQAQQVDLEDLLRK